MILSMDDLSTVVTMHKLLTKLVYSQDTNPVERAYLADLRERVEAVRVMPVLPCD